MRKLLAVITGSNAALTDFALLVLRVAFGGLMLVGHGWGKLQGFPPEAGKFPDPLGIGTTASMGGAVFSEFICAGLLVLGLFTRAAALPLVFTMLVAAFVFHADDPLFLPGRSKEPAVIYASAFAVLLLAGGGRFSVDGLLSRATRCKGRVSRARPTESA